RMINDYHKLSIYVKANSVRQIIDEAGNFFENHYLIILFGVFVVVARRIVNFAKKRFAIGRIDVKSVKPGDINFTPVLFSIIPLLVKIYSNVSDGILVCAFLTAGTVFGLIMKSSYHYNLTLKLILGYSHYEVQTKEEITYLILSKKQLINKNDITKYVKLADHMLLNIPDKT
ncbi:MAG: hypothetical protein ABUL44_04140, partial [Flavobacterium sp.]